MRFGLNWLPVRSREELEDRLPLMDDLGLGTIDVPDEASEWSIDACREFGEMIRSYGLTVGEWGYWENLLTPDEAHRTARIEGVRSRLRRAEAMGADCVVTIVGSAGDFSEPHVENYGEQARERARENCHRILDGLDLQSTMYALEPWYNSFFHTPQSVRAFLDSVDDDRLGVHMDAMNMLSVETAHRSTEALTEMFDLLGDDVAAVHAKDLRLVPHPTVEDGVGVVAIAEVPPGEGVMAYEPYLEHIDDLSDDVPVYTEHWDDEATYVQTMEWLGEVTNRLGIQPVTRD